MVSKDFKTIELTIDNIKKQRIGIKGYKKVYNIFSYVYLEYNFGKS